MYTPAGRSMLYMSLRLFDDYDLFRFFQLDIVKFLRFVGECFNTRTSLKRTCLHLKHLQRSYITYIHVLFDQYLKQCRRTCIMRPSA